MTAEAAKKYEQFTSQLLRGRTAIIEAGGIGSGKSSLSATAYEIICTEMDDLWWQMTAEERATAEERLKKARQATAPKSLGLVDVPVEEGESHLPREEG